MTEEERHIIEWVDAALEPHRTRRRRIKVIKANPKKGGTRPKKPYVTVRCIAEASQGQPVFELTDTVVPPDKYAGSITEHYTGTVSINIYGDEHQSLMRVLMRATKNPTLRELTKNNRMYISRPQGAGLTSALLDTTWEDRSQQDFRYFIAEVDTIEAEGLEEVHGTVQVDGAETTLTSVVEVP